MTSTIRLALALALSLLGCGASPAPAHDTPAREPPAARPQSLDEGISRLGLTRIELAVSGTDSTYDLASPVRLEGRELVVVEQRGFSSSSSVFARRNDGAVVLVEPAPNVIVDRHVDGGCLTFAGGRGWFETVRYTLPEGATYAGVQSVPYDEHTEVVDHGETEPDGSPCPPPALD